VNNLHKQHVPRFTVAQRREAAALAIGFMLGMALMLAVVG
jgi:hypothetical protein